MRLILIRHGQTPANVLGQLDTAHPGPGLTERGFEQAAKIPDALRAEAIDAIFASTLLRTQLTAQPLADDRGLAVTVLGGIHEIDAGDLEGKSDPASVRAYLEPLFAWGRGDLDVSIPGGEDGRTFLGRFDADIAEIVESGVDTAVVVSHGAAIRVWVGGNAMNITPKFTTEHELMNTGIVILEGSFAEGWTLLEWESTPVGGASVADERATDPTGEAPEDLTGR